MEKVIYQKKLINYKTKINYSFIIIIKCLLQIIKNNNNKLLILLMKNKIKYMKYQIKIWKNNTKC